MAIEISQYRPKPSKKTEEKPAADIFSFLNKDISLFGNSLSDKKKEQFYSELNILLTSGIDIKTALELIGEEQRKKRDQVLFTTIKDKVINGGSLSDAIEASGKFSPYEFYSLRIGEETGRINDVLDELSSFFNKKIKQRRQVISALTYPSIVMLTAVGAIFFMMNFIVPMFAEVFLRFGGDLPYITKLIINTSNFFSDYFFLFFILVVSAIIFIYTQRKKEWFRKAGSSLAIRLPLFGDIITKIYLARFCQAMSLLLTARTPLITSIQLVKKMVGFYPLEESLTEMEKKILRGESLHKTMGAFPVYNKRMISLVKVAEEVNQLDVIFGKLSKQYGDEVEHQSSVIGSLLEPFIIIFLGLIVGIILIAMYLPLFQLGTSIG